MSLSTNKNLTYAGLLSSVTLIAFDLLVKSPFHRRGITSDRLADYLYLLGTLLWQCAPFIIVGIVVGFVLRRRLTHSYLVAIFALLYVYALSNLLSIAGYVHFAVYALLTIIVTIGLFYASNWFFNFTKLSKAKKIFIATLIFPVVWTVGSFLCLYIVRVIESASYTV